MAGQALLDPPSTLVHKYVAKRTREKASASYGLLSCLPIYGTRHRRGTQNSVDVENCGADLGPDIGADVPDRDRPDTHGQTIGYHGSQGDRILNLQQ